MKSGSERLEVVDEIDEMAAIIPIYSSSWEGPSRFPRSTRPFEVCSRVCYFLLWLGFSDTEDSGNLHSRSDWTLPLSFL